MSEFNVTIARWTRRRRNAAGKLVLCKFFTVNFSCPETGKRRRLSFPTRDKAEAHRAIILAEIAGERYFNPNANAPICTAS